MTTNDYKVKVLVNMIRALFNHYDLNPIKHQIEAWGEALIKYEIEVVADAMEKCRRDKEELPGLVSFTYAYLKERNSYKEIDDQFKKMSPELKRKSIIAFFKGKNVVRSRHGKEELTITDELITDYSDKGLWEMM